jgi:hypothetical protein
MPANTVAPAAFTRRHYQQIADAISGTPTGGDIRERQRDRELVVDALAALFTEDNPRFDRARFVSACEVGGRVHGMPANYRERPLLGAA